MRGALCGARSAGDADARGAHSGSPVLEPLTKPVIKVSASIKMSQLLAFVKKKLGDARKVGCARARARDPPAR